MTDDEKASIDAQLATSALQAFRDEDYQTAVKNFVELLGRDGKRWECRLYLAMAYGKLGKLSQANQEFDTIAQWCPNPELKEKAKLALRGLSKRPV
jgi:Flp pilus assembly protein TadD